MPPLAPQRPQFGSFADPASKLFNLALLLSGIAFGCNAFLGIMGLALAGPFALAGFICSLAVMIKYESSAGITALLAAIFLPGIGFCVNLAFVAALATSH